MKGGSHGWANTGWTMKHAWHRLSLQDQLSLQNGARIVHIDALLPCVGEPDVIYMRQQVLNEISLFLSGCQRTSVAGLKTTAASSKEGNSRYSQTKIKRSAERSLSLASADRCSTTSCWRRNAISASRAACDLNTPTSNPPSSFRRSIIPAMRVAHRGSCASPDAIFGSHTAPTRGRSPPYAWAVPVDEQNFEKNCGCVIR